MAKISNKKELEIRHKADSVESVLKKYGICRVPNDVPGFCAAVAEVLRRRYPDSDLICEAPPRNFGGEYTFRSASHLGTKDTGNKQ